MTDIVERFSSVLPEQWERVIATALLVTMGLLASQLWARYLAKGDILPHKRRLHLVWSRNIVWLSVGLGVVAVWASTIAGFALSLAAVAGALLIVSKELIMCVHGYLYLTLVQPFKIDDVVELNHLRGRVIDIDMFATTLAELDEYEEQTGKIIGFPNGLLLTTPLRNISSLEDFGFYYVRIPMPPTFDQQLEPIEQAAIAAGDSATLPWRDQAIAYFRKVEQERFIDLPSGRTKATWDFTDSEHLVLVVRIACPHAKKGALAQAVFKDVWQALCKNSLI